MKKALTLVVVAVVLTGCGQAQEDQLERAEKDCIAWTMEETYNDLDEVVDFCEYLRDVTPEEDFIELWLEES